MLFNGFAIMLPCLQNHGKAVAKSWRGHGKAMAKALQMHRDDDVDRVVGDDVDYDDGAGGDDDILKVMMPDVYDDAYDDDDDSNEYKDDYAL